jgi:hypothetical protein
MGLEKRFAFIGQLRVLILYIYIYNVYIYIGLEKRFAFIGQLRVRNQAKKAVQEAMERPSRGNSEHGSSGRATPRSPSDNTPRASGSNPSIEYLKGRLSATNSGKSVKSAKTPVFRCC